MTTEEKLEVLDDRARLVSEMDSSLDNLNFHASWEKMSIDKHIDKLGEVDLKPYRYLSQHQYVRELNDVDELADSIVEFVKETYEAQGKYAGRSLSIMFTSALGHRHSDQLLANLKNRI